MSAHTNLIRPLPPAGSGDTAANSRAEERQETVAPGSAPERPDIIIMPLRDGGELRVCAVHGRVEILARFGKGRVFATTPVTPERAEHYGSRITRIAQLARAQRDSKRG